MTDLAYMVREDWGQHGTGMAPQSKIIRDWLGDLPTVFATTDLKKYASLNSADREFVEYVVGSAHSAKVVQFQDFRQLRQPGEPVEGALVALHPYLEHDCQTLNDVVDVGRVSRLFVIVWSRKDMVRIMLDGLGAIDLHTGGAAPLVDPVQLEAAKCMVSEQYNGLSSGNGKAAVVQLVRAFTAEGYPLDTDSWLRAFFAAKGEVRHAESISKLVMEMQKGVKHRVRERYRPEIVSILRERAAKEPSA
ncbi:hypothetical protein [Microbacterium panaciterrae]|uniref:Uncharacterized protein n=1 Tax=Microbacterium panaciterrae TaxID=985759 RepID=A0ABP8P633_9MICO